MPACSPKAIAVCSFSTAAIPAFLNFSRGRGSIKREPADSEWGRRALSLKAGRCCPRAPWRARNGMSQQDGNGQAQTHSLSSTHLSTHSLASTSIRVGSISTSSRSRCRSASTTASSPTCIWARTLATRRRAAAERARWLPARLHGRAPRPTPAHPCAAPLASQVAVKKQVRDQEQLETYLLQAAVLNYVRHENMLGTSARQRGRPAGRRTPCTS